MLSTASADSEDHPPNQENHTMAHTGQKAPASGIWKPSNGGTEVALSKGDRFPPSKGEGTGYQLVRPTR